MKSEIVDLESKFFEAGIQVGMTQYYENNSNHYREGNDLVDELMEQKQVTYLDAAKIIASKKADIKEINITFNKKI